MYIDEPHKILNFSFLDHVLKLKNILYGFKQAHRAWYEGLSKFMIENNLQGGKLDTIFYIKKTQHDILLIQIYVYGNVFGATNESFSRKN